MDKKFSEQELTKYDKNILILRPRYDRKPPLKWKKRGLMGFSGGFRAEKTGSSIP